MERDRIPCREIKNHLVESLAAERSRSVSAWFRIKPEAVGHVAM